MLTIISVFTCLVFASLYPLCFWIVRGHPIANDFRKFNILITNLAGGFGLVIVLFMNVPLLVKVAVAVWKAALLSVSSYSWKKEKINLWLMSFPSILGIFAFAQFQKHFMDLTYSSVFAVSLGGVILCLSLFSMILGHWYLNVPGLPIRYLVRSTYIFWFSLGSRGIWDLYTVWTQKIIHTGDMIYLYQFILRVDGFLILVPLFFGTFLPIFLLYFVHGTLKVKSTQSATGLLYIIVIAILMGDLAYKYYFYKFGVAL